MDGAMALGSTRWESIRGVMFAYAAPGIAAAVLLGLGRAFGEAIAVNQTIGSGNTIPTSWFEPGDTLGAPDRSRSTRVRRASCRLARSSTCRHPDGHLARHQRRRTVRRQPLREGAEGGVSATPGHVDPLDVTVHSNGLRRRRIVEKAFGVAACLSACIAVGILALVLGTVLFKGFSQLELSFFTKPRPLFGEEGGIADALVGTR